MASKPRKGDSQAVWLWGWDESDDEWKYIRVEGNAIVTQDVAHMRIHDGQAFEAGKLWGEGDQIADNASAEMLVQASGGMHSIVNVAVSGDFEFFIFEGPTISAAGTAITAYNQNRFSSATSSNTITHTPTISGDGTQIAQLFLPGGSKDAGSGASGNAFNRELILKTGEDYLLRATNRSGGTQSISITLEWYES